MSSTLPGRVTLAYFIADNHKLCSKDGWKGGIRHCYSETGPVKEIRPIWTDV